MMHRCSGSCHGTMVGGPCSCGLFYGHQSNSFSMLFSVPNAGYAAHQPYDEADNYSFESSSVDCTLSLGTPSTRLSNDTSNHEKSRRSNSRVSNFCWDMIQSKHSSSHQSSHKSSRSSDSGIEKLLSRRCANCDTTSTPLWRNGPKGPKSLCNACGIRFKKEEKRASAASTASSHAPAGAAVDGAQHSSWVHHHSSSQNEKTSYISSKYDINEFKFIDDDDHHHHRDTSSDTAGIPYLTSWRLNRPAGLVHGFTR